MPGERTESGAPPPEEGHLFAGYETDPVFYDEMFDADGAPHAHCRELWAALGETPSDALATMQERAERSFLHEGITFSVYGEEGAQERIIPIDIVPRIVAAEHWDFVERGLRQRLDALNLFLADIYGPGRIIADGVIPADLVQGCPQFRDAMRGVDVPHGAYVSVCGTDLVRTHDGFLVLEDNLRVPSGISYMLANRAAVKTSLRDAFRRHRVRGIEHYGRLLRRTLAELSPHGGPDPTIVLLTPGVYNSAFYEHMFLAQRDGCGTRPGQPTSSCTTGSSTCAPPGAAARRRDLPPRSTTISSTPSCLPVRFSARHARAVPRLPARQRDDRQRARGPEWPTTRASMPTCRK